MSSMIHRALSYMMDKSMGLKMVHKCSVGLDSEILVVMLSGGLVIDVRFSVRIE